MKYTYYPGCTMQAQARNFEDSLHYVAGALGMELEEMERWHCCGGVYPLSTDNVFHILSPARNLSAAARQGKSLVTACSACYNVHRRTAFHMKNDAEVRDKVNRFLRDEEEYSEHAGQTEVLHFLTVLRDQLGWERVGAQVKRRLEGLRAAAYYGCLLLRPPEEVAIDDPEDPRVLEELLETLGATVVDFPYKTECCGAYLTLLDPAAAGRCTESIINNAGKRDIDLLVTSCPLCHFNLDALQAELRQQGQDVAVVPVTYFTQLMGLAFGAEPGDMGLAQHEVDPRPVLAGIIAESAAS